MTKYTPGPRQAEAERPAVYPLNDVEIELTDNLYGQANMYMANPATGMKMKN